MSRPAPHVSPSAVLLGYKIPIPLKIVLVFGITIFVHALYGLIFDHTMYVTGQELEGWSFIILFGGLLLFLYANSRSYRIAWDAERVYMREWGFRNVLFQRQPFHSIAYNDIVSMEGRFGNNAAAKSRYMPYEYLEIASNQYGEKDVWIYPLSLNQEDLADFLVHLYDKRPDIFPDIVLKLMRQDGINLELR